MELRKRERVDELRKKNRQRLNRQKREGTGRKKRKNGRLVETQCCEELKQIVSR